MILSYMESYTSTSNLHTLITNELYIFVKYAFFDFVII